MHAVIDNDNVMSLERFMQTESYILLTKDEMAEILNTTVDTLARWRRQHLYRLLYVKIGGTVQYRLQDVRDFIDACTVVPVAQGRKLPRPHGRKWEASE